MILSGGKVATDLLECQRYTNEARVEESSGDGGAQVGRTPNCASAFYEWEAAIMNETEYIQGNEGCELCSQAIQSRL